MNKRQVITLAQLGLIPPVAVGCWLAPGWIPVGLVAWFAFLCVGVTVTYHRLLAHRAFEAPGWFVFVGSVLGFLGSLVSPIEWPSNHADHHRFTDRPGDPHSPVLLGRKALLFAFHGLGKPSMTAKRLMADYCLAYLHRHQWDVLVLWLALVGGLLGWRGVVFLWAMPCLMTLWSIIVGIYAHGEAGPKRQGWLVAIATMGEQNHDRHHENPRDWSADWPASWVIRLVQRRR